MAPAERQMLDDALDRPVDDGQAAVVADNQAEVDELLREARCLIRSEILEAGELSRIVVALPLARLAKQSEDMPCRAGNRSQV